MSMQVSLEVATVIRIEYNNITHTLWLLMQVHD